MSRNVMMLALLSVGVLRVTGRPAGSQARSQTKGAYATGKSRLSRTFTSFTAATEGIERAIMAYNTVR